MLNNTDKNYRKFTGYTLAEVLITLGVIGVVASLTIPRFIHNYKMYVLHNQFLKTDNMISHALSDVSYKLDLGNLDNILYRDYTTEQITEMNEIFLSNFDRQKFISYGKLRQFELTGFGSWNKTTYQDLHEVQSSNGIYILKDGIAITGLKWDYYYELSFAVDINGLGKGPNRVGYDVFIHRFGKRAGRGSDSCATSRYGRDDIACYEYARMDINPQDSTKKYWKSLK